MVIREVSKRSLAMTIMTLEGIVEKGQVRLNTHLNLPDDTRVYVVVPDIRVEDLPQVASPRLLHPEQAADFRMEVINGSSDAVL